MLLVLLLSFSFCSTRGIRQINRNVKHFVYFLFVSNRGRVGFYCFHLSHTSIYLPHLSLSRRLIATREKRERCNKEAENEIRKPGELGNISVVGSSYFKSGITLSMFCGMFCRQSKSTGTLTRRIGPKYRRTSWNVLVILGNFKWEMEKIRIPTLIPEIELCLPSPQSNTLLTHWIHKGDMDKSSWKS
jgi:hypothetical protein